MIEAEMEEISLVKSEESAKDKITIDSKTVEDDISALQNVANCPKEGVENEQSAIVEAADGISALKKVDNCSEEGIENKEKSTCAQSEKPLTSKIPIDFKMVELGILSPKKVADCSKEGVPESEESAHVKSEEPHDVVPIDSKMIADGISALKILGDFSKEGVESTTPLYSDDSATIYLQFTPKKLLRPGFLRTIRLQHPLSYKRDVVCVMSQGMDQNEEKISRLKPIFKEIGMEGNIEIMSIDALRAAVSNKEDDGAKTFVERYDTCFSESSVLKRCNQVLQSEMGAKGKIFHYWKLTNAEKDDWCSDEEIKKSIARALCVCGVFGYSSMEAYVLKVAHTGYTDIQMQENIQVALEVMHSWRFMFPKGFKHFHSIHLKTGVSKGIPLYINDGEVEDIVIPVIARNSLSKNGQNNRKRKSGEESLVENSPDTETLDDPTVNAEKPVALSSAKKKRMRIRKRKLAAEMLQDTLQLSQEAQNPCLNESTPSASVQETDGKPVPNTLLVPQQIEPPSVNGSTPVVNILEAVAKLSAKKKYRRNKKKKLVGGSLLNPMPPTTVQETQNQCSNVLIPAPSMLEADGKQIQHPSLDNVTPVANLSEAVPLSSANKKGKRNRKRKLNGKFLNDTSTLTQDAQKQCSIESTPSVLETNVLNTIILPQEIQNQGLSGPPSCVNALETVTQKTTGPKKKRNRKRKLNEEFPLNAVPVSASQEIKNESLNDLSPVVNMLDAVTQNLTGNKKRRKRKRKPNIESLPNTNPSTLEAERQHLQDATPLVSVLAPGGEPMRNTISLPQEIQQQALNGLTPLVAQSVVVTQTSAGIKKRRNIRKRKPLNKKPPLVSNNEPPSNTLLRPDYLPQQVLNESTGYVNTSEVDNQNKAGIKKKRNMRKRKLSNKKSLLVPNNGPLHSSLLRPDYMQQALNDSTAFVNVSEDITQSSASIKKRRKRKRQSHGELLPDSMPQEIQQQWSNNTTPVVNVMEAVSQYYSAVNKKRIQKKTTEKEPPETLPPQIATFDAPTNLMFSPTF